MDYETVKINSRARDHMANERTFLAWIRTSIGIMAFGFVVEKFALFLKQIALVLGDANSAVITQRPIQGYSSILGVLLVALGALICLLAFVKYKRIEKQIDNDKYHPSTVLNVMLALAILLIGLFLVIYLSNGI